MGWILETNEAMNRAMEGMGGKVVKRTGCTSGRCRAPGWARLRDDQEAWRVPPGVPSKPAACGESWGGDLGRR